MQHGMCELMAQHGHGMLCVIGFNPAAPCHIVEDLNPFEYCWNFSNFIINLLLKEM